MTALEVVVILSLEISHGDTPSRKYQIGQVIDDFVDPSDYACIHQYMCNTVILFVYFQDLSYLPVSKHTYPAPGFETTITEADVVAEGTGRTSKKWRPFCHSDSCIT